MKVCASKICLKGRIFFKVLLENKDCLFLLPLLPLQVPAAYLSLLPSVFPVLPLGRAGEEPFKRRDLRVHHGQGCICLPFPGPGCGMHLKTHH